MKIDVPDNVTNGDIVETLFPDIEVKIDRIYPSYKKYVICTLRDDVSTNTITLTLGWWDAPYIENKEVEE